MLMIQDSLNSAAGGNFFGQMARLIAQAIIEKQVQSSHSRSKSIVAKVSRSASTAGVSPDVVELTKIWLEILLLECRHLQFQFQLPLLNTVANTRGGIESNQPPEAVFHMMDLNLPSGGGSS
ncbi:hypothetical protein Tco_1188492 [Tanacetum coccineum]